MNSYQQLFESGSMWIHIEMASLDPDPYFEYRYRIRIQDSQNEVQKGKNMRFHVKKSIDHFAKGLMALTLFYLRSSRDGVTWPNI